MKCKTFLSLCYFYSLFHPFACVLCIVSDTYEFIFFYILLTTTKHTSIWRKNILFCMLPLFENLLFYLLFFVNVYAWKKEEWNFVSSLQSLCIGGFSLFFTLCVTNWHHEWFKRILSFIYSSAYKFTYFY